ncbi:MAG: zinc-binding dehydrogenase [Candidatus Atribacteria bacterium]|nr:zinc-binding dehydrogenase [Candidatus Atribacteria bacterium]
MKALVKFGKGENDIELREITEPIPQVNEVKVKVEATGICGTDLYGYSAVKPPVVLGHETAGMVVEVGEEVKNIKVGDRVTAETTAYICGQCNFCHNKEYNLCIHRKGLGSAVNGAFAEYFVIRKESIHHIPPHIDFNSASLFEPLSCAVHAVIERANLLSNETVLILGPGPLGLLTGQIAKSLGAKIIICGIEGDENRLSTAKKLGINQILNIKKKDTKHYLSKLTVGYGVDVVFECSGSVEAVEYGLNFIRKGGRYIQEGIIHQPIQLRFDQILFDKELSIIGSRTQKPSSWDIALNLVNEGKVNLKELVSDVLPLSNWKEGFKRAKKKNSIKIVLQPDK